jgi:hypothetical protein
MAKKQQKHFFTYSYWETEADLRITELNFL